MNRKRWIVGVLLVAGLVGGCKKRSEVCHEFALAVGRADNAFRDLEIAAKQQDAAQFATHERAFRDAMAALKDLEIDADGLVLDRVTRDRDAMVALEASTVESLREQLESGTPPPEESLDLGFKLGHFRNFTCE